MSYLFYCTHNQMCVPQYKVNVWSTFTVQNIFNCGFIIIFTTFWINTAQTNSSLRSCLRMSLKDHRCTDHSLSFSDLFCFTVHVQILRYVRKLLFLVWKKKFWKPEKIKYQFGLANPEISRQGCSEKKIQTAVVLIFNKFLS